MTAASRYRQSVFLMCSVTNGRTCGTMSSSQHVAINIRHTPAALHGFHSSSSSNSSYIYVCSVPMNASFVPVSSQQTSYRCTPKPTLSTRNRKHRRAAAKPAACAKPLMLSTPGSKGKREGRRGTVEGRREKGRGREEGSCLLYTSPSPRD